MHYLNDSFACGHSEGLCATVCLALFPTAQLDASRSED